jgi:hypothetical protein
MKLWGAVAQANTFGKNLSDAIVLSGDKTPGTLKAQDKTGN